MRENHTLSAYQGLRKALLQMDRKQTRKKAQALLKREQRVQTSSLDHAYELGQMMIAYIDHNYAECIRLGSPYLRHRIPNPNIIFTLQILSEVYQLVGMGEESFVASQRARELSRQIPAPF